MNGDNNLVEDWITPGMALFGFFEMCENVVKIVKKIQKSRLYSSGQ